MFLHAQVVGFDFRMTWCMVQNNWKMFNIFSKFKRKAPTTFAPGVILPAIFFFNPKRIIMSLLLKPIDFSDSYLPLYLILLLVSKNNFRKPMGVTKSSKIWHSMYKRSNRCKLQINIAHLIHLDKIKPLSSQH